MIQAGKVRLYCRIIGEGQSCVLLHGSFVDGSFWKEQISALSQEFRVVVPDLRGHGLSDKPSEEYTHEVMAQDIRNLLRTLGIRRTSLVGHSMGSRIALQSGIGLPRNCRKACIGQWRSRTRPKSSEHISETRAGRNRIRHPSFRPKEIQLLRDLVFLCPPLTEPS